MTGGAIRETLAQLSTGFLRESPSSQVAGVQRVRGN